MGHYYGLSHVHLSCIFGHGTFCTYPTHFWHSQISVMMSVSAETKICEHSKKLSICTSSQKISCPHTKSRPITRSDWNEMCWIPMNRRIVYAYVQDQFIIWIAFWDTFVHQYWIPILNYNGCMIPLFLQRHFCSEVVTQFFVNVIALVHK